MIMTRRRALALSLAIVAVSTIAAGAQTLPWPTDAPRPQSQAPWPGSAPPAQPMTMPAPGAPMGPPGASAPSPQCLAQFNLHREEVEKRAIAARTGGEKHVSREEMCKLVGAYAAAEAKWIKYSEDNMVNCGIPKEAVSHIKTAHTHTMDIRKKICSAGPGPAGPATPSLSDALGTTRLPLAETEKRKSGGTLDTLTGNPLAR
jgi:hypothetical protein